MTPEPEFYLQIVDRKGMVARLPGGGALEADLVDLVTRTVMAKGVGIFRTSTHVEQDIRNGILEALRSLKYQTTRLV